MRARTVFGFKVKLGCVYGNLTQCPSHHSSLFFLSCSIKQFSKDLPGSLHVKHLIQMLSKDEAPSTDWIAVISPVGKYLKVEARKHYTNMEKGK